MRRSAASTLILTFFVACADQEMGPVSPGGAPALPSSMSEQGAGAPRSIAFHSDRAPDGNREIYLMNPDGSGVERVTNRPETSDFYPDISPNGKWIVFTSTEAGGPGDIYLVGSAGGPAINLTNTPAINEDWARWSPNGQQIAFHRGAGAGSELYLLDLASREETRLTNNSVVDMWPEWAPDGKRLAFRRGTDVYVMDLSDPEHPVQLTTHPALDQMAAWSPNGKQLAFMSFREGYCSVFIMNADGSDQRNLTPGAAGWCSRAPAWTRDGRILFMSARPGTAGTAIFVMKADGAGLTPLTDEPGEDGGPTAR